MTDLIRRLWRWLVGHREPSCVVWCWSCRAVLNDGSAQCDLDRHSGCYHYLCGKCDEESWFDFDYPVPIRCDSEGRPIHDN
jgi:hypothetical protein